MVGVSTLSLREVDDWGRRGEASPPTPRWIDSVCPGFYFNPTDQDLIVHFLRRRVVGQPLPCGLDEVIPTLRLYGPNGDPRFMFDDFPQSVRHPMVQTRSEFYAFTHWEHGNSGKRPTRSAGPGTWSSNHDKSIRDSQHRIIGHVAHLTFKIRGEGDEKSRKGPTTHWVMHEYRLPDPIINGGRGRRSIRGPDSSTPSQNQNHPSGGRLVLCRIRYTGGASELPDGRGEQGSPQLPQRKRVGGPLEQGDEVSVWKRGRGRLDEDERVPAEDTTDDGGVVTVPNLDVGDSYLHGPSSGVIEVPEPEGGMAYVLETCPLQEDLSPSTATHVQDVAIRGEHPGGGTTESGDDFEIHVDDNGDECLWVNPVYSLPGATSLSGQQVTYTSLLLNEGSTENMEMPELAVRGPSDGSFETTAPTIPHEQGDIFAGLPDLLVPTTGTSVSSANLQTPGELVDQGYPFAEASGDLGTQHGGLWFQDDWYDSFTGQGTLCSFDTVAGETSGRLV